MPQEMKLSFIGLANWDGDLFSTMNWPDPFNGNEPVLDKESFLLELFAQTAELEVIYPNPTIMKQMIGIWSKTRLPVWNLLWDTTQYEYNPIENYNRIEDGTDTDKHTGTTSDAHTGNDTETHSGVDTERNSGTDSYGETLTKTGTDTNTTTPLNEKYIAAYDSAASGDADGLVKTERDEGETVNETEYDTSDETTGSTTHGHVVTNEHGHVVTTGHGETITHGYADTMTKEHDLNVHGNIGTVTTQQMIKEQREIVTFNFYDVMIRDFKDRFCILVY